MQQYKHYYSNNNGNNNKVSKNNAKNAGKTKIRPVQQPNKIIQH
jgi:hypothetical protein